ncbi:MAG: hypothetical protein RIT81_29130 [Deltaproteobacteria bacterium]
MLGSLLALSVASVPGQLTIVGPADPVEIEAGQTVLVEVKARVARPDVVAIPPVRAVIVRPTGVRSGRNAKVLSWIEVVKVSRRFVTARVPVTGLTPGRTTVAFGLEIRERGAVDPVGVKPVSLTVKVIAPTTTAAEIEPWVEAFTRADGAAKDAHRKISKTLRRKIPIDRLSPYPREAVEDRDLAPLARFYGQRLRALAAQRALRAAADADDAALARKATLAIGSITPPVGEDYDTTALQRLTNAKAIAAITRAIDDLRVQRAHAFADALLSSGRLDLWELAEVLALRGFVMLVRGEDNRAERELGRAYCVRADLEPAVKRPWFVEAARAAKTANACTRPLAVDRVVATHVVKDDTPALEVIATFGPDPHHLVAKANIQLWGYDGALDTSLTVPALHAKIPRAEARLTGSVPTGDGYALIKVFLLDANGTELVATGDPDPLAVPVVAGEGSGGPLPWWVWAIAGGVVVAGAATAGVVALSRSGDVERVIGPVDVRF